MAKERAARGRRRKLRRTLIVLLLVAVVVAGVVLWQRQREAETAESCTVTPPGGKPVTMDVDQGSNAATIAAVTIARGLPERALTIALATSLQESKLRNLDGGDRDSIGLFQQRPSQGWGTADQIRDPVYATNKFLDALVKVPGYAQLPLTEAAQDVQHSGYPDAYAKHETNATLLASALTGRAPATFTCTVHQFATPDPAAPAGDAVSPSSSASGGSAAGGSAAGGAAVQQVGDTVRREFGRAVSAAAVPATGGTASAAGTTLALTPNPAVSTDGSADAQTQSGWAVAQWAVAHAQELGIGTVSYDGKLWRADSSAGWTAQSGTPVTNQVLATLGMPNAKH
ncbi:hypothetical protein ACIGXM_07450 [Kitasatospora sp. NPDC052896]|uniref:hypothetical protein n=1 Tax=Kitasatospora sp. NPDC052896 TaxID=3364061 RepID=UPI0037C64A4B